MPLDNFEQHVESFVLDTQNDYKSAQEQINRLNIAKNELLKIFGGFQIFKHALWQKMKTRKCQESTESFLNQKAPSINALPLLENC